ncbi:hypothetical protein HDE_04553 [Halotydeus destructor]|nr:hypothetical protein HDE_04553 [Halotydeus destructor]
MARFTTELANTLDLDENFEVGLAELSYTYSWLTFKDDKEIYFCLSQPDLVDDGKVHLTTIKSGYYPDPKVIVDLIQTALEEQYDHLKEKFTNEPTFRLPALKYGIDGKVTEVIGSLLDDYLYLCIPKDVRAVLGLSSEPELIKVKNARPDMTCGRHSIFVYSNIVDHSLVGDSYEQLLRIADIPTELKFGSQIVNKYSQPQYLPLRHFKIKTIEIELRDDTDGDMDEYYTNQAGSGLGYFQGDRYQKGHGLLSTFFSKNLIPLITKVLPYIGEQAFKFGGDVINDIGMGNPSLGGAVKKAAKRRMASITEDALVKVKNMQGGGKRKKRKPKTIKRRKTPAKTTKKAVKRRKVKRRVKTASDFLF